jgi:DUF4097 and DUF4098 domain-containing protein YvlB
MWRFSSLLLLTGLLALGAGCGNAINGDVTATREGGSTINGAIRVPAGQQVGSVSTVNGSITVEDGATAGAAHAVNGEIKLGAHATVDSAASVNGSVILGNSARVKKDVKSVNGEIELQKDSEVAGSVTTVDGSIRLTDARVGGGLSTVAANIDIMGGSHVDGGILVEKNTGTFDTTSTTKPRIVIGPGATVQGNLTFKRDVLLYVSDKATIGPVAGATAVMFEGDKPAG